MYDIERKKAFSKDDNKEPWLTFSNPYLSQFGIYLKFE